MNNKAKPEGLSTHLFSVYGNKNKEKERLQSRKSAKQEFHLKELKENIHRLGNTNAQTILTISKLQLSAASDGVKPVSRLL